MEQNIENKNTKTISKKVSSGTIRFEKGFMKDINKLVDKANKKEFGRKIKPKVILINLLKLATPQLLDEVVKRSQEDSLSHNDKRELFIKEKMSKFRGSKEQLEAKMMEVFDQYLSQNPV